MTASLWQHLRFIEAHSEFSFLLRSNHYLSNIVGLTTLSAYLGTRDEAAVDENMRGLFNARFCFKPMRTEAIAKRPPVITFWSRRCFCIRFVVQQRMRMSRSHRSSRAACGRCSSGSPLWPMTPGKLPHLGDCDNGRVELLVRRYCANDAYRSLKGTRCASVPLWTGSYLLQIRGGDAGRGLVWATTGGRPANRSEASLGFAGLWNCRAPLQGEASVVFCAMPNGLRGKGSHTHCDKLSIVFRLGLG